MELNETLFKRVKFSIMFVMGLVILIKPNSLLTILLFVMGIYLLVIGFNALISSITLIKYNKGWIYDGVKFLVLTLFGAILTFNASNVAVAISGIIFVVVGLGIIGIGVAAIIRTKENSAGILFIVLGLLIALFPLGVSFFITRIIGISLMALAAYLIMSVGPKSS